MKKSKKKISAILFSILMGVFAITSGYTNLFVHTLSYDDTTSFVSVGELYNDTTGSFDRDNLNILYKYISGNPKANFGIINNLITSSSSRTANTMMKTTIAEGVEGSTAYTAKSDTQDINVDFAGFNWTVTYLSKDKRGNTIATLWMTSHIQEPYKGRSYDEGEYYGFIDHGEYGTGMYSDFSYNWSGVSATSSYTSNLYGLSYISAVTLNNGGKYATSTTALVDSTQNENSVFARLTMPNVANSLTDYIVTPEYVSWQEIQRNLDYERLSGCYNYPNDAWSNDMPDTDFRSVAGHNYANREGNECWKNDYLWLPSRAETSANNNTGYNKGMWHISNYQRQNYGAPDDTFTLTDEPGSKNTYVWYQGPSVNSWIRSASLEKSYIYQKGQVIGGDHFVSRAASVRPAIHLNLTAIEDTFRNTSAGNVNNSDGTINKSTLSNVYKYLSGSSSATISTISSLATSGMTAEDIREVSFTAGDGSIPDKLEGEDLTITFGGLRWDIVYLGKDKSGNSILTLWLSDFNFDAFNHRSSTEGEHYGYLNGALYSDWSCDWNSTTVGASPSNMYGSSYIRAVTLNNGGTYSTGASSSATATQNADSVFAPFTMSGIEGSLTQYLVKPSNVSWQESGQTTQSKFMYNCSNENWSTSTSNDGYYQSGAYNYASKSGSDSWKNDYVWLPSMYEIGYGDDYSGMWQLSYTQRTHQYNAEKNGVGVIGSNNGGCQPYAWLRTASSNNSIYAYGLNPSYQSSSLISVNGSCMVRPCIHLNLTALDNA